LRDNSGVPPEPDATIVVSTHNRAHLLPRLIEAFERQTDTCPFDVVIVDDCSTDDTWPVLQRLSASTSLSLRTARTPKNSGPSAGRNIGWRAATAPLIAFTDDDCVPEADWLGQLTRALDDADVAQGRTEPDAERAVSRGPFARTQIVQTESGLFETCNIAYRRSVLEQLGGFDETYRRPYGEDVDLGWRAKEAGARAIWVQDAVVVHDVEHTTYLRDWVAAVRNTRRRHYAALMVKQHPGLRAQLPLRYFLKRHHPATVLALCGIGVLAVPWARDHLLLSGVLVAPWLAYRGVIEPLPARRRNLPAVLPLALVADVAEVTAVAAGSIRFRTLLL
jgi:GT2 family glycosyltransferase